MKKILCLLVTACVVIGVTPEVAHADSNYGYIEGRVYIGGQGTGVEGAILSINCEGKSTHQVTSYNDGRYHHFFEPGECPAKTHVEVSTNVIINGQSYAGIGHGYMWHNNNTTLNFAVVNVEVVPEYSWLGGALAAGSGIGVLAIARRRYVG